MYQYVLTSTYFSLQVKCFIWWAVLVTLTVGGLLFDACISTSPGARCCPYVALLWLSGVVDSSPQNDTLETTPLPWFCGLLTMW